MRSFFQNLEREAVRYILISGQASILYGAAMFSEDVDLWIEPTEENIRRFARALHRSRAVAHKLTPPLEEKIFRRGHGFHFRVPSRSAPEWYLDVMGKPPRVPGFSVALRRIVTFETAWGRVPVVAVQDLAEMKKTRRLGDYEIISNLACIRLRAATRVCGPLASRRLAVRRPGALGLPDPRPRNRRLTPRTRVQPCGPNAGHSAGARTVPWE
jgi:hypothetical protein